MLVWFRSTLFNLSMLVITPIFSILAVILHPTPAVFRSRMVSGWAHCTMWLLALICNIRYVVIGKENIPTHPSIVLAKHQSAWETIALQAIFPPQIWVLKRELLWIPILGWAFAALESIAIDRSAGRESLKKMVAQGKDRLSRGLWVVIFPEGTRVPYGEKGKYHMGGALLATHTQSTVVPVAHNAGLFWPKNSFLKYPGTITVSIGKPIDTTDMKADALNNAVETWIEAEIQQLPKA